MRPQIAALVTPKQPRIAETASVFRRFDAALVTPKQPQIAALVTQKQRRRNALPDPPLAKEPSSARAGWFPSRPAPAGQQTADIEHVGYRGLCRLKQDNAALVSLLYRVEKMRHCCHCCYNSALVSWLYRVDIMQPWCHSYTELNPCGTGVAAIQ